MYKKIWLIFPLQIFKNFKFFQKLQHLLLDLQFNVKRNFKVKERYVRQRVFMKEIVPKERSTDSNSCRHWNNAPGTLPDPSKRNENLLGILFKSIHEQNIIKDTR